MGLVDEQIPRGTWGRISGLSDQRSALFVASLAPATAAASTSHTQKKTRSEKKTEQRTHPPPHTTTPAGRAPLFCPAGRNTPVRMIHNNITTHAQRQAPR